MLYRIIAPHFTAGFLVENDVVIIAAPIIAYMRGWTIERVTGYTTKKKWILERLEQ